MFLGLSFQDSQQICRTSSGYHSQRDGGARHVGGMQLHVRMQHVHCRCVSLTLQICVRYAILGVCSESDSLVR